MPVRSPIVSKDKQIREAIKVLRENDVATDFEDIERELGHASQPDLNGGTKKGQREVFWNPEMPADSCERLNGVPNRDDEGREHCILRGYVDPSNDDEYQVKRLQPAEE